MSSDGGRRDVQRHDRQRNCGAGNLDRNAPQHEPARAADAPGVPNLSGAITASAEAGLQIVRLSSVCPPEAVRPHLQEGYLLGEYPEMAGYDQKQLYAHYEIDFGRRLIAKFRFDPKRFWKQGAFPKIGKSALYPDATDPMFELAQLVKKELGAMGSA